MLKARDIMSPVNATITPSAPLAEAIRRMAEQGTGYLPVVGEQGQLLGWVTEGDLIRLLHRVAHAEEFGTPARWLVGANALTLRALPVAEVVTRDVDAVAPDASVEAVAELIFRKQRKAIPVVENGKAVGTISRMAVIQALL